MHMILFLYAQTDSFSGQAFVSLPLLQSARNLPYVQGMYNNQLCCYKCIKIATYILYKKKLLLHSRELYCLEKIKAIIQ